MNIERLLNNCATEFEHAGLRVLIVADQEGYASDPQDNDNAGTIFSWSDDFQGDDHIGEPDLYTETPEGEDRYEPCSLETYMQEQYGMALTIGLRYADYGSSGARLYQDDSDPNCCICFTQAEIDDEWSGSAEGATKYALNRVKELDEWLQGYVFGVVVCSPDDGSEPEVYDSVWGFIGDPFGETGEYIRASGRELAEEVRAVLDEEAAEAHRWACADVVTVEA